MAVALKDHDLGVSTFCDINFHEDVDGWERLSKGLLDLVAIVDDIFGKRHTGSLEGQVREVDPFAVELS